MEGQLLMLVLFIITPTVILGDTPITNCGPDNIKHVNINNCTKIPCILEKGKNASIEVEFTAELDSKTSTSQAYGIVHGVKVPYSLPDKNGCKGMSPGCPIKKGALEKFSASLYVKELYPSLTLIVEWEEVADDGKTPLFCLMFGAQIR